MRDISHIVEKLDEDFLSINEESILEEFASQPKKFAQVSLLLAHANQNVEQCQMTLELVQSDSYKRTRKALAEESDGAKVTEAMVQAAVAQDEAVREVKDRLLRLRYERDVLVGMQRGLDHRKEMLKTLGFALRQEKEYYT